MASQQYKINQRLSLMIPRIFPQWTNEQHIMDVFHKQDIGKVYKVTIVRIPDEPGRHYPIYQAFIYFSVWYDNDIAYHFQQRIYTSEKKQTKVVYDDPWFWVVFENKKRQPIPEDIRAMKMEYQLYKVERQLHEQDQQLYEQGQCIQQLQECLLLKTTTAINNSFTTNLDVKKTLNELNCSYDDMLCCDTRGCDECDTLTTCSQHYQNSCKYTPLYM